MARKKSARPRGKPPKNSRAATTERSIKKAERAARVLDLRKQGWTLQQIGDAETPRISAVMVHKIIKEEMARITLEPAEDILKLELARLDDLQTAFYEKAMGGDAWAVDRVLAIMDRRAKYLGLDQAPKKDDDAKALEAKKTLVAKLESLGAKLLAAGRAPPLIEGQALPASASDE